MARLMLRPKTVSTRCTRRARRDVVASDGEPAERRTLVRKPFCRLVRSSCRGTVGDAKGTWEFADGEFGDGMAAQSSLAYLRNKIWRTGRLDFGGPAFPESLSVACASTNGWPASTGRRAKMSRSARLFADQRGLERTRSLPRPPCDHCYPRTHRRFQADTRPQLIKLDQRGSCLCQWQ